MRSPESRVATEKTEYLAPLTEKERKHIWVQQVAVHADMLETRVKVARARGLDKAQEAAADGACEHIHKARNAALRDDPKPQWLTNWRRGTLVVAAYRNLHGARIQIVDIIDEPELQAEIPFAIARARATLPRDDARQTTIEELQAEPVARLRARLRRLMDDSYEVLEDRYAQLRSFRNILLLTAGVVAFLVLLTIGVVSRHPNWVPLCFPHEEVVTGADGRVTMTQNQWTCPSGRLTPGAASGDIVIVSMLGALGGALAAAISIRHLRGTSTPYDVPVALAALKVPLGAFTAILALMAIQGVRSGTVDPRHSRANPGLCPRLRGFAQQALTRLLDQRAQTLLEDLPGGAGAEPSQPVMRAPSGKAIRPPSPPGREEADGAGAQTEQVDRDPASG